MSDPKEDAELCCTRCNFSRRKINFYDPNNVRLLSDVCYLCHATQAAKDLLAAVGKDEQGQQRSSERAAIAERLKDEFRSWRTQLNEVHRQWPDIDETDISAITTSISNKSSSGNRPSALSRNTYSIGANTSLPTTDKRPPEIRHDRDTTGEPQKTTSERDGRVSASDTPASNLRSKPMPIYAESSEDSDDSSGRSSSPDPNEADELERERKRSLSNKNEVASRTKNPEQSVHNRAKVHTPASVPSEIHKGCNKCKRALTAVHFTPFWESYTSTPKECIACRVEKKYKTKSKELMRLVLTPEIAKEKWSRLRRTALDTVKNCERLAKKNGEVVQHQRGDLFEQVFSRCDEFIKKDMETEAMLNFAETHGIVVGEEGVEWYLYPCAEPASKQHGESEQATRKRKQEMHTASSPTGESGSPSSGMNKRPRLNLPPSPQETIKSSTIVNVAPAQKPASFREITLPHTTATNQIATETRLGTPSTTDLEPAQPRRRDDPKTKLITLKMKPSDQSGNSKICIHNDESSTSRVQPDSTIAPHDLSSSQDQENLSDQDPRERCINSEHSEGHVRRNVSASRSTAQYEEDEEAFLEYLKALEEIAVRVKNLPEKDRQEFTQMMSGLRRKLSELLPKYHEWIAFREQRERQQREDEMLASAWDFR